MVPLLGRYAYWASCRSMVRSMVTYPRKGDGSENLVDSGKKCDGSIVGAAERVATLVAADDFPSAPLGRHYAGTKHGVVKGE